MLRKRKRIVDEHDERGGIIETVPSKASKVETTTKPSTDEHIDDSEDDVPLSKLLGLDEKELDLVEVEDDSKEETVLEEEEIPDALTLEDLESPGQLYSRPFASLSLEKQLGLMKTLLRVGDFIRAGDKSSKLLGKGKFEIYRLSLSGLVIHGKNPSKQGKITYRIHWRRCIAFFKQERWSVYRKTTTGEQKRATFYEWVMTKAVLCRKPSLLAAERRKKLRQESLKVVKEANFKSLDTKKLSKLLKVYEELYFPGLKKLAPTKIHFEVSKRFKSLAGACEDRRKKMENDILIKISQPVLFGLNFPMTTRINGVECANRLEVLLCVFEHELVHAVLQLFCPSSVWGHNGGHTLAFQHMVQLLFGHTHYKHELLVGDIEKHDKKKKDTLKESIKLKKKLKVGTVLYLVHEKKQLLRWGWKKNEVSGWKGEAYQILKKNPKRLIVLYTKDIRKKPLLSVDKLDEEEKEEKLNKVVLDKGKKYERYTIPYTYLIGKESE